MDFITTKTGTDRPTDLLKDVAGYVNSEFERFQSARHRVEETWLESWSAYLGTPEAQDFDRMSTLRLIGDANGDWRHRINVGKAFESVETIHSYLIQAIFPNRDWFSVSPMQPGYLELSKVIKKYMGNKFQSCNFRSHWETFLRQLIITGNSVMALPWRYETVKWKKRIKVKVPVLDHMGQVIDERVEWNEVEQDRIISNEPAFEALDVFDVFIDPQATDPNDGALVRRLVKTRASIIQLVKSGLYKNIGPLDVIKAKAVSQAEHNKNTVRLFQGVDVGAPYNMGDLVELYEYWGDVHLQGITYHDVVVTVMGDKVLRFEPNPYWAGKPFIVGSYIPVVRQPYAMGAIQPSLGMLHQLNTITNQRLDNIELAIDSMWQVVDDGVTDISDIYTAPGKIIQVAEMGNIAPVARDTNFTVSYQEASVLESSIDKNFGTGPLIGVGQGRGGERVTAAEIQAVRDAGGNRLSGVHKHIEDTSLLPLLSKVYRLMQQFVTEDEVVRVTGSQPGENVFIQVGPQELSYDFQFAPVGADHVTDKQQYIQTRLDFIASVSQNPEMAAHVDFKNILLDLVQHFGFEEPEKYIKEAPEAPPQEVQGGAPVPQEDPLMEELGQMGGQHLQDAFMGRAMADGDESLVLNELTGIQ